MIMLDTDSNVIMSVVSVMAASIGKCCGLRKRRSQPNIRWVPSAEAQMSTAAQHSRANDLPE